MTDEEKLQIYRQFQSGADSETKPAVPPEQRTVQKAVFPTIQELYYQREQERKNAIKYGFAKLEGDEKPKEEEPPASKPANRAFLKTDEGNGYRKVAKFLMLINKDDAAQILRQFPEDEIQKITEELSTIRHIDKHEAQYIMDEFKFIKERQKLPEGGIDVARRMLVNTFGEEDGRRRLQKSLPPELQEKPFDFLKDLEPIQVYMVLKKESSLVLATIVPFLPPALAKSFLEQMEKSKKVDIIKRIAKCEKLDLDSMKIVETALKEKVRTQGKIVTEEKDGKEALAGILKYMSLDEEKKILLELEEEDEKLYLGVKEKIWTIDMIVNVDDIEMQKILASYSDSDLAILIKGKSAEIEHKILSNVSATRKSQIEQERIYLGQMRRKDVDEKTASFVAYLRQLELEGKIDLRKNEKEIWI